MVVQYIHENKIYLKLFIVSLFETRLNYQTQRMCLLYVKEKWFLIAVLHMKDNILKPPYFKSLKEQTCIYYIYLIDVSIYMCMCNLVVIFL